MVVTINAKAWHKCGSVAEAQLPRQVMGLCQGKETADKLRGDGEMEKLHNLMQLKNR